MTTLYVRRAFYSRPAIISTDDETDGLPGSPDVMDFVAPRKIEPIPQRLRMKNPAWIATAITTLAIICVTIWDWATGPSSFSVSQFQVLEKHDFGMILLSMMSHSDLGHLMSNLIGFIGFGYLLKSHYGTMAFPILPGLLGLMTTLITIMAYPPEMGLIGSSGVVFSMVGTWVTLYFLFEKRLSKKARLMRVLGFMLILFFPSEYSETTSYLAHGVGFALGVLGGLVLAPFLSSNLKSKSETSSFQIQDSKDTLHSEDREQKLNSNFCLETCSCSR